MTDSRTGSYAEGLARMIRAETVSAANQTDRAKFYRFHDLLREMFPQLFSACTFEDFDGSFMLCRKGASDRSPLMLMNHHDVVEAAGSWRYPPFSGTAAEGRLWGRGTLDTKGGLWAMLQAAEELEAEGFVPEQDIYFVSACTEETDGSGADRISRELHSRGIRFGMVLDEGGMIVREPIGGADGSFAMVGLGEKSCTDLRFIARSAGGHASTPGKNSPLVRLGRFMAAADRSRMFKADIPPTVAEMFRKVAGTMPRPLRFVLGHPGLFKPLLLKVIPMVSDTAGAMLRTTLAFTQAKGSDGANVLPHEACVVANLRCSHHQGETQSLAAIRKLADKFDIETEVMDPGFESPLSDCRSDAFRLVERAVSAVFPDVITTPYLMTGASDCRYMSRVCDSCIRFIPFRISDEQLASIHSIDENVNLSCLAPAVDFYKYIIKEARL